MTKQETDNHNLACLEKYMLETGVKPEDFDKLPFGDDEPDETEYYHTREAATAHLESVGLTFDDFEQWMMHSNHTGVVYDENLRPTYPASWFRLYIRENHQLNEN